MPKQFHLLERFPASVVKKHMFCKPTLLSSSSVKQAYQIKLLSASRCNSPDCFTPDDGSRFVLWYVACVLIRANCLGIFLSRIRMELRSILILLASCQQTCTTYTTAVCTVKNSWWWAEELSETCEVSFQKQIWEISASSWFYYNKFITMHGHMCVKLFWNTTQRRQIPTELTQNGKLAVCIKWNKNINLLSGVVLNMLNMHKFPGVKHSALISHWQ